MRHFLLVLLAPLIAGCVLPEAPTESTDDGPDASDGATGQPSDGAEAYPIVTSTIRYDRRTNEDGSDYQGAFVHGCPSGVRVDESAQRAYLADYPGDDPDEPADHVDAARAALVLVRREPVHQSGGTRNHFPTSFPFTATMEASQPTPTFNVTLEDDRVVVNDSAMSPGTTKELHFEYDWQTGDGKKIHVEETVTVRYHGRWVDPFRTEQVGYCI